jgi:hypothetical protein
MLHLLALGFVALRQHMTVSIARHFASRLHGPIVNDRFECIFFCVFRADLFHLLIDPGFALHVLPVGQELVELAYHGRLVLLVVSVSKLEDPVLEIVQLGILGGERAFLPRGAPMTNCPLQRATERSRLADDEMLESHQVADKVEERLGWHGRYRKKHLT